MSYTRRKQGGGRQRPVQRVGFIVLGVSLLAVLVLAVLSAVGVLDGFPFGLDAGDTQLIELWNERAYADVVARAEANLAVNPYDGQALTFGGFAHFYTGVDALEDSDQRAHLQRSVQLLRKALHVERAPLEPERHYVLAKAYYHMGDNYMDLSVELMERSLDLGYDAPDSRSYLGLAYANLGRYESSASWFEQAIEYASQRGDNDGVNALRVRAAETYSVLGQFDDAQRFLQTAIAELDDEFLRLMARNELADVLIKSGQYGEAEQMTLATIEEFPESADAHYYLGVVYFETDRRVEARDMWRTARRIDPNHAAAFARLAGNWEN